MDPGASEASCVTACNACARVAADAHRRTRPPTTADAANLECLLICRALCGRAESVRLRRGDGEVHVLCQRLVRQLVGNLDLQAIVPLREARQRHGLAAP